MLADFTIDIIMLLATAMLTTISPHPFFAEYGGAVAGRLRTLHGRGANASLAHNRRPGPADNTQNTQKAPVSVFVTQYDPGTYRDDLQRHAGPTYDYRIGRAMFETTGG